MAICFNEPTGLELDFRVSFERKMGIEKEGINP
jgi:hypothetical protein